MGLSPAAADPCAAAAAPDAAVRTSSLGSQAAAGGPLVTRS